MGTNTSTYRRNLSLYIGVDVGKAMLDIDVLEQEARCQLMNAPTATVNLVKDLQKLRLTRIVVEATGEAERG